MQNLSQGHGLTFQAPTVQPKRYVDNSAATSSTSNSLKKVAGQTLIVMQGEFGIAGGEALISTLKTTRPTSCHVIALYNSHSRIAVLAHMDDYTSIGHMLNKISKVLSRSFKVPLGASFQATIAGGGSDSFSIQQKNALKSILATLKIKTTTLPLSEKFQEHPQINLDTYTGKISLDQQRLNNHLEYLQQREYGEFNNFLDAKYGNISGAEIPFFKAQQATRTEKQLTTFEWVSIAHAQQLEKKGQIQLPIKQGRVVTRSLEYKFNQLEQLVASFNDARLLKASLQERNFNLMLRQAASSSKYLALLKFLLKQRIYFEIDTAACAATSGTALDVAKKFSNLEAIELLQTMASP